MSIGVSATENIFNGFKDDAKVQTAKINLELAQINLRATKAKLSADLRAAYASLVYAQNLKLLGEKIFALRSSNLRQVELRYQGGRENKGSVLLSVAYLEQAKFEQLQTQQNLEVAQEQLAQLLDLPVHNQLTVISRDPDFESGSTWTSRDELELSQLQKLAADTPEVLTAFATEKSSKASLQAARSGFWPSLDLSASSVNTGSSWYPGSNQWSVGATLTYNFSAGGKDYFGTQAARETLQSSLYSRASALRQSLVKLQKAFAAVKQSSQKLIVDRAFDEAAILRSKIGREKYNNGILSFDEWDLIENDSITRQKTYLQSLRDQVLSEAAWEQAQGKGAI